eukprot:c12749_g1_i1.p1 GENE.c12749_g1_i1~~c12749_g1_i1.p1  ORF type:complete len:416 (+),score=83.40 c12749_g1_i1:48-1295(+)
MSQPKSQVHPFEYDDNKKDDEVQFSQKDRCLGRFCLSLTKINGNMDAYCEYFANKNVVLDIVFNALPRSIGQVTFMNNPITGFITFLALAGAYPGRTFFGVLGILVAHLAVLFLGLDRKKIRTGFYGYNAFQCSMALCAFLAYPPPTAWTWFMLVMYLCLVSCFSVILQVAVTNLRITEHALHPMTWSFSLVTLCSVLMALKYNRFPINEAFVPTIALPTTVNYHGQNISSNDWKWTLVVNPGPMNFQDVMLSTLRGVSQVYLNNNAVSGFFLLLGMMFCSRISAVASFVGSLIGVGTAQFMGVEHDQIREGIWGYCGALAALSIAGIFYVLSFRSFVVALFAACVATFINAGLASYLSVFGIPTMSFGFLLCNIMFSLVQRNLFGLTMVPLEQMSTAEENLARYRRKLLQRAEE